MTTMLLAHRHPAVRAWVCDALTQVRDVEFVAEASDDREVSCLIEQLRWDVALISCSLLDGILAESAEPPGLVSEDTRVVVLGAPDCDGLLYRLWRAGVLGYVREESAPEAIAGALRDATDGKPLWTADQVMQVQRWWDEVGSKLKALTERERQVLDLMADGLSNHQIARRLHISARTIQTHVSNILGKLDLETRQQAIVFVLKKANCNLTKVPGP